MSTTSGNAWTTVTTPYTLNQYIGLCAAEPETMTMIYYNDISYGMISKNSGVTWFNLFSGCKCENINGGQPDGSGSYKTYGCRIAKSNEQYFIIGSSYQDDNSRVYGNNWVGYCDIDYDITVVSNWTWTVIQYWPNLVNQPITTDDAVSNCYHSAISGGDRGSNIFAYYANSDASGSSGYSMITYVNLSTFISTSASNYINFNTTTHNVTYDGINVSPDGIYMVAWGYDATDKKYFIYYYDNSAGDMAASKKCRVIYSVTYTASTYVTSVVISNKVNNIDPVITYTLKNIDYPYYCNNVSATSSPTLPTFIALGTITNSYVNCVLSNNALTLCAITTNAIIIYTYSNNSWNTAQTTNAQAIVTGYLGLAGNYSLTNILTSVNGSKTMYLTNNGGLTTTNTSTTLSSTNQQNKNTSNNKNLKKSNKSNNMFSKTEISPTPTESSSQIISGLLYFEGRTGVMKINGSTVINANNEIYSNNYIQTLNAKDIYDVKSTDCGLNVISKLKPITYKLTTDTGDVSHIGFTPKNITEATTSTSCSLNMVSPCDKDNYNIEINSFFPLLVNGINELSKEIKELKNKNKKLNKKICNIKKKC